MKSFKNLLALSLVGLTLLTACSKAPVDSVETTVTTTAKTEEIPVPTDETVANINSFLTELSMCRLGDFKGEKDY
ncbi:MAG: hypothetical protein IJR47_04960, partial [Clostridia bacterium]|nr:hypothetical protein [Clostridia bacterium]